MFEEQILPFFVRFAYEPHIVYLSLVGIMFASSFGLPIPEEVTLISAGLVCYLAASSPPPYPGAQAVETYTTAAIALAAVILSDLLIYSLGRFFGQKVLRFRLFRKYQGQIDKVSYWVKRYGQWAAGLFRFTPGLRFPGHFSTGMLGLSVWKFLLVDGSAALVSVPIQIILVAEFGKEIIANIKEFQTILIITAFTAAATYFGWVFYKRRNAKKQNPPPAQIEQAEPTQPEAQKASKRVI
jgi:membrane protein DedA with SNARE-associated domain